MNKFLYVFNDDLAKKLDSIGYKTYSQEKEKMVRAINFTQKTGT